MATAHYKVILSYKGSGFAGFQRQKAARTVQGEFEASLRKIGWQENSILSAGRTDAGVHARGQVVSFHLAWEHSATDLLNALNYYLPKDIAVKSVAVVSEGFHPRYDAKKRSYCYHLFCQPQRDPVDEVFAWRVWPPVNLEWMQTAATGLIGSHDFSAFGSPVSASGVTTRTVFSAKWRQEGKFYHFDITANAFLYHMVRRMTYAFVLVGQGKAPRTLIEDSLKTGKQLFNGIAPPEGLVLEEISYL